MRKKICIPIILFCFFLPLSAQTVSTIAEARQRPLGTEVTISGAVTVAGEFGPLIFVQDQTAGIGIYDPGLVNRVAIGDSIIVSGILTEFGAQSNQQGTGLLELTNATLVQRVKTNAWIDTLVLNLHTLSEASEGRLVKIDSVFWSFLRESIFPDESKNYGIFNHAGKGVLRIDRYTSFGGEKIPLRAFSLVGILSQYRGEYQIQPRFLSDVQLLPVIEPADEEALDIITWNLNWFGNVQNGSSNDSMQFLGVLQFLRHTTADIYFFQEISNLRSFSALLDSMPGYRGFIPSNDSVFLRAFLIDTSEVDFIDTALLFRSVPPDAWAGGRYPYALSVVTHGLHLHCVNLHLKAGNSDDDYLQRASDANILYNGLSSRWQDSLLLLGGDWNDQYNTSIVAGRPSPYLQFTTQESMFIIPNSWMAERGVATHRSGTFIDFFILSRNLLPYIRSYKTTVLFPDSLEFFFNMVSDHLPFRLMLTFTPPTSQRNSPVLQNAGIPRLIRNGETIIIDGTPGMKPFVVQFFLLSGEFLQSINVPHLPFLLSIAQLSNQPLLYRIFDPFDTTILFEGILIP